MTALPATPSAGGQLEPATQVFIDSLASAKPIDTLSPEAARAVLADAQKSVPVTLPPASVEDRVLNVGPKGDRETHDRLVRELTVGANAVSSRAAWMRRESV